MKISNLNLHSATYLFNYFCPVLPSLYFFSTKFFHLGILKNNNTAFFSTLLTNLMLHYIFNQNKSTVLDKITLPGENEPKSRRWRGWTRRGRWWVSACPPVRQSCQREEQWSGPDDAFKDCLRHNWVGQWSGPDMTGLQRKEFSNSPLPQLLSIPSFCAEWSGSSVTLETTYIQKQHGCYKITPSFDLFLCALCACVSGSLCVMTHSVVTAVGSQMVSLQSNKTCTYWSQQHQN